MEFKDYYKILGVEKNASADEIKKSYRKLARKYHPDVSKEADASARMAEVNEANTVLSDPEKRAAYDNLGKESAYRAGQDFRAPPNWDAGYEFTGSHDGDGMDSAAFSDFFEQMFGRAARAQRGAGGGGAGAGASQFRGGPPPSQRGEDHHAKIELDLQDSYSGAERMLTLRGARLDDSGHLVNEERQLQVTIPKGVREGQLIRLSGQGSPGFGGAPNGDLFLEVQFKPDTRWRAQDRDVYQSVNVTPWEAELGGPVEVTTPNGSTVEVNIPAHSKSGRKLRLKERGLPAATPGDLYLELHIVQPQATTEEQRAAYAHLAKAFPQFNPRSGQ
ncbi:DnaJ C-terminal domain-containing protein [Diaphorobacter caeni]|uniref:DnaJ C-terminal domain-containing protein n=1 Tax=Diaphorobacter caeni TaxID=2784387 RepID=UPI00188E852A|nr:DnaJ C-terminal domain-containing protein [Diaphorobacter caeni]MBF5003949.1 DnaJ domain-containing protein [Diaphorobacter caeni]